MGLEGTSGRSMPDPEQVREKYRAERSKRFTGIRDNFRDETGRFSTFLSDPYSAPVERDPILDDPEVVVIGAGLGGLSMAARLRESGVERIRLIDKAGDVGGVWYWNRYPGAMCDIESYIYLPLLEEMEYIPKSRYARAPEILAHCQAIAKRYDLYEGACFQTAVTQMHWDEQAGRWLVRTDRGDELRARFVVMANGPQNRPKILELPGDELFRGRIFHSSRWEYDFTGGHPESDDLPGLRDKVVGVIGTGASAIQIVPPVGRSAKHLYVFQRTPSTIGVRGNRPTDPEWARSLQPGWQRRRLENFTAVIAGAPVATDLVDDGWTEVHRQLLANPEFADLEGDELALAKELADIRVMEAMRARIDDVVKDPATADALKPYYRYLCKRPCFHDEYLATFNRPNVTIVDTRGRGVERLTETGAVANGREYQLDCLIYATGFEVRTAYTRRSGYDLVGRGGVSLTQKWAKGLSTLHGLMTAGFPNLFIMPGRDSQATVTVNHTHTIYEETEHIAYVINECRRRAIRACDVSEEAEQAWVDRIVEQSAVDLDFLAACTPGEFNNEGDPERFVRQNTNYGAGPLAYFRLLREWRDEGKLRGLDLST